MSGAVFSGVHRDFIVLRHSERLDETNLTQWRALCAQPQYRSRDRYSLSNDPPITNHGFAIAMDAAITIKRLIESGVFESQSENTSGPSIPPTEHQVQQHQPPQVIISSSKFLRCIQTAQYLAQLFDLPIHASSGLGLTAFAAAKGGFNFLSMEALQHDCDSRGSVQLIDCDPPAITRSDSFDECFPEAALNAATSADFEPVARTTTTAASAASDVAAANDLANDGSLCLISDDDWLSAIESILLHPDASSSSSIVHVIVAHRETIRNLCEQHVKLPYCAIGLFRFRQHAFSGKREILPLRLLDSCGRDLGISFSPLSPHTAARL